MSHSGHAYDEQDYADELEIPRPSASFRVPRRRAGIDRTTRNMALVAAAIAALIVLAVAVQALVRPHGLPVVGAQSGPWREKPANPGGMQVTGAGNAIFNGTTPSGQDKVMPGPETPDLAALARDEHQAAMAPQPAVASTNTAAPNSAVPAVKAALAPPSEAAAPKTAILAPPATDRAPTAAVTKPVPASSAQATGHTIVQLAALPTEAAARSEWERLAHRMPSLLDHRAPVVTKAEVNGQTWWRLRTGGFASAADARDFCAEVKAKGGGCAVERS
jgi:hypothetical protein